MKSFVAPVIFALFLVAPNLVWAGTDVIGFDGEPTYDASTKKVSCKGTITPPAGWKIARTATVYLGIDGSNLNIFSVPVVHVSGSPGVFSFSFSGQPDPWQSGTYDLLIFVTVTKGWEVRTYAVFPKMVVVE